MEQINKIQIKDVEIRYKVSLERYTTIRLQSIGSIAICKTEKGLQELIRKLNEISHKYHVVGWGANQVLLHTNETLFIKLDFPFDKKIFEVEVREFELPANFPINILTSIAIKKGFKGWEVFTGIPASLGGAIAMNAGTSLGEIGNYIRSVRILDVKNNIREYVCNTDSFSYRSNTFLCTGDIILSAKIFYDCVDSKIGNFINEYLTYRKRTQPLTTKNCGSVFKNYKIGSEKIMAGKTIDNVGLKGFGNNNIFVSYKHGNFIDHNGGATSRDFLAVALQLQVEVERYSGLKFEFEVKVY